MCKLCRVNLLTTHILASIPLPTTPLVGCGFTKPELHFKAPDPQFDPEAIDRDMLILPVKVYAESPPVGTKPAGKPVGIHHVFLNGRHVVKDGSYVDGARAGRVLRR